MTKTVTVQQDVDTRQVVGADGLTLETQSNQDREVLHALVPHDQARNFRAAWDEAGRKLVFAPLPEQKVDPEAAERARLNGMSDGELQTLAAERSVTWDAKASKATMVGRILKAAPAPQQGAGK